MPEEALDSESLWPSTQRDDRRTRDALDRLLLGFQIIGFNWEYLYVNPAAARHGRRTPRELVGRSMPDVYPGIGDTDLFRRLERCMRERRPMTFQNEFVFPDGSRRWFEIRVQPVPEGICIYSEDIQAWKDKGLSSWL
jgi:two-component system cell cycle sensor histidine kinase/response regulator CckA